MSEMPIGWDRARSAYENACNEPPRICQECDCLGDCKHDPTDCESDAIERAAEARREAARDAWD